MWIGQLSGRQGSTVATHSRFSSFFRNRVMPVNPRTPAQTLVRDAMTAITQNWKSLTDTQREAWTQLAQLVPLRNSQGVPIILTGHLYYVRFNLTRRSVSLARLDTAPPNVEQPPSSSSLTLALISGPAAMNVTPVAVDGSANNFFAVYATQILSPGVSFIDQSKYRLIDEVAGNVATPFAILPAYETVFGAGWQNMIGMQIAVKLLGISDTGFEGESVETSAIIA